MHTLEAKIPIHCPAKVPSSHPTLPYHTVAPPLPFCFFYIYANTPSRASADGWNPFTQTRHDELEPRQNIGQSRWIQIQD